MAERLGMKFHILFCLARFGSLMFLLCLFLGNDSFESIAFSPWFVEILFGYMVLVASLVFIMKKIFLCCFTRGIPGDGRCLFRSVVHGACLREGNPSPGESYGRQLADELRGKVAEEFIKRRADSEWFVEGDFDTYVRQIRQPHIWGGEPELLMSSHVLQAPITVFMRDTKTNRFKVIVEYGQEYGGTDNPICVLYNGYGHYDALQNPTFQVPKTSASRLCRQNETHPKKAIRRFEPDASTPASASTVTPLHLAKDTPPLSSSTLLPLDGVIPED